jgi:hypothetical protein
MSSFRDQIKHQKGGNEGLVAPCIMSIVHEVVHDLLQKVNLVKKENDPRRLLTCTISSISSIASSQDATSSELRSRQHSF